MFPERKLTSAEKHARLAERIKKERYGKRSSFTSGEDLLGAFWRTSGVAEDKVAILNAVWDREIGSFKTHWTLEGVKRGTLHVRVKSSASAQELAMRSRELVRTLNKHFRTPWIKQIKFKVGSK